MQKINRRSFLKIAAAGSASLTFAGCNELLQQSSSKESKRPNFLFLFTDDQKLRTIHALNNPEIKTPNLDRLVKSGTAFTNTYIMGSHQPAVCMPSRAMLMTGRGFFHLPDSVAKIWAVPPQEKGDCPYLTFPEVLRNAGYTTFATGKQHNGTKIVTKGFAYGGNLLLDGMMNHSQLDVWDFDPTGKYPPQTRHKATKFSSEFFSDEAINFIKNHDKTKPFMMYVAYNTPHDPRIPPKEYADMYPPEKIKLPKNFMPEHPFDNGELKVRDELLASFPRTPQEIRKHIADYYAMITHLDAQIGRVLKALKESGQADNTIIIFASDNGLAIGEHGLMGKQNLYEHSAKVPLIFAGPGIKKGQICSSLCYLYDIFPTMCDLAHVQIPDSVESKSLLPLLKNPKAKVYDSTFFVYTAKPVEKENGTIEQGFQKGVRQGDWKLIMYNLRGKTTIQLFNVSSDPLEMKNLANDLSQAQRIEHLKQVMKDWMKKAGDNTDIDKTDWAAE